MPLYWVYIPDPDGWGMSYEADTLRQAKAHFCDEFRDYKRSEVTGWRAREMVCLKHERPMKFCKPIKSEDDTCGYCSGEWDY